MRVKRINPIRWDAVPDLGEWWPTLDMKVNRAFTISHRNFIADKVNQLVNNEENMHRQSFVGTMTRFHLTLEELESNINSISLLDRAKWLCDRNGFYLILPITKNLTKNKNITEGMRASIISIRETCRDMKKVARLCEMIVELLNFVHLRHDYLKLGKNLFLKKIDVLRSMCQKCGENFDELFSRVLKVIPPKYQSINPFKHGSDVFFEYLHIYHFIFDLATLGLKPIGNTRFKSLPRSTNKPLQLMEILSMLEIAWKTFLNHGVKTKNLLDLEHELETKKEEKALNEITLFLGLKCSSFSTQLNEEHHNWGKALLSYLTILKFYLMFERINVFPLYGIYLDRRSGVFSIL